jgi:gliding motility-associated protein GldM
MSLPKEPRQKMINMMYLVLTALLALNVSSEILNAFKTIDRSLKTATGVADTKNKTLYQSFADKLNEATTREKAAIWKPKAEQAKSLSEAIYAKLEAYKQMLKKESGLEMKNGAEAFKEDDLDASTRLFIKNGEGQKLLADLQNFKQQMLAIEPSLKGKFETAIPLNFDVPPSQDGTAGLSWEYSNFHMTPTVASITILSKLQNDVKNTEAIMVEEFHNQIGKVEVRYDKFAALVGTNSTYLLPGQDFEINAGIGAFNSERKPTVTVNGQSVAVDPATGMASFKTKASGSTTYKVSVSFTDQDGKPQVVTKDVPLTVGTPSDASVFLKKMNVMYLGVDNPLTISAGSIKAEKASVNFTGGGSISKVGGSEYTCKPSGAQGTFKIVVSGEGKSFEFPIRVKSLPNPAAFVGGKKGGIMSAAQFRVMGGMTVKLEDSEFEYPFSVVSYTIGFSGKGFPDYAQTQISGPQWGAAAANIAKCVAGTVVYFDNIKVKGPDKDRVLDGQLVFRLN